MSVLAPHWPVRGEPPLLWPGAPPPMPMAMRLRLPKPPIEGLVKIGAAAAALGVGVETLRRWERAGRIAFERRGGQRYISSRALATLVRERSAGAAGHSSAGNRMPGTILAVKKDGVAAQVELACGPYRIVALISREGADELGLKAGEHATAVVEPASVIVERG